MPILLVSSPLKGLLCYLFRFTKRDPRYVPAKATASNATVAPESGTDSPESSGEGFWGAGSAIRVKPIVQVKASARRYLDDFFIRNIF